MQSRVRVYDLWKLSFKKSITETNILLHTGVYKNLPEEGWFSSMVIYTRVFLGTDLQGLIKL